MAKSVSVSAPVKILSATQAASDIFKHPGGIGVFIGLRGHAGGEWSLFAEFPDETQSSSTPQHSQTCTGLFYSYGAFTMTDGPASVGCAPYCHKSAVPEPASGPDTIYPRPRPHRRQL